jgi:hypothetical protein
MAEPQARYQEQTSRQTLAEGLEEYYALNLGKVRRPEELAPDSAALFRSHDICHVVFGLTTSMLDETLVDVRSVLATDVGLARYAAYLNSDPEAKAIFQALGWRRALALSVAVVPRALRALGERLRMRKAWPWSPPPAFLQRPLCDLRTEFRIRVF